MNLEPGVSAHSANTFLRDIRAMVSEALVKVAEIKLADRVLLPVLIRSFSTVDIGILLVTSLSGKQSTPDPKWIIACLGKLGRIDPANIKVKAKWREEGEVVVICEGRIVYSKFNVFTP